MHIQDLRLVPAICPSGLHTCDRTFTPLADAHIVPIMPTGGNRDDGVEDLDLAYPERRVELATRTEHVLAADYTLLIPPALRSREQNLGADPWYYYGPVHTLHTLTLDMPEEVLFCSWDMISFTNTSDTLRKTTRKWQVHASPHKEKRRCMNSQRRCTTVLWLMPNSRNSPQVGMENSRW
ncbi:uncharacterized protein BCR38DRAFT_508029 [Pseudomassariella vexata]|uniref:Uncharacterized protein n=1 Tax=Pseudomassariella vexata TaxID=1141098 RepID=A0A1Y2EBL9_9PEZI|nr:uncharacterized protein BCR38DRAFT_508029 [Pseudomassariella vexata]ORY68817.1 hypothetical protein BCR38DRAFT_508029 [Pseudomassariella vexata]